VFGLCAVGCCGDQIGEARARSLETGSLRHALVQMENGLVMRNNSSKNRLRQISQTATLSSLKMQLQFDGFARPEKISALCFNGAGMFMTIARA